MGAVREAALLSRQAPGGHQPTCFPAEPAGPFAHWRWAGCSVPGDGREFRIRASSGQIRPPPFFLKKTFFDAVKGLTPTAPTLYLLVFQLPGGVMVAQRFLVPFVKVRILAGQPLIDFL